MHEVGGEETDDQVVIDDAIMVVKFIIGIILWMIIIIESRFALFRWSAYATG